MTSCIVPITLRLDRSNIYQKARDVKSTEVLKVLYFTSIGSDVMIGREEMCILFNHNVMRLVVAIVCKQNT